MTPFLPQFKYVIHPQPETQPAIILVWADTPADLEAIQVGQSWQWFHHTTIYIFLSTLVTQRHHMTFMFMIRRTDSIY